MIEETNAKLKIADGEVSHALLDATRIFHKEVTWHVYEGSPRKDGSVQFDTAGRVTKVHSN